MTWTLCFAAFFAVYIVLYDVFALATNKPTITQQIRAASSRWPMIPFLVGFIMGLLAGHLFWVTG